MKRFCFILSGVLFFSFSGLLAQNEIDALRYSQTFPVGTAKSLSMGGAIGAVGGDFTSLSVNPAGIGLYRASEFTISPSMYWNTTTSDFRNESYTDEAYKFGLGNIGLIFNNNKGNESGWISTSFGFGYNNLNNFNKELFMRGINNTDSYLDNFVDNANNNIINPMYEQLALDADLLPLDPDTDEYWNDIQNAGYGQTQKRYISSKGSLGEYNFSFGANYNHKLYLGASLGIMRLRFEQIDSHEETDPDNIIPIFHAFEFEEYLNTRGTGYSFKIGVIGRPISFIRIGAAYHLPSFYYLNDLYENTLYPYFDADAGIDDTPKGTGRREYDYRLRTPSKLIGSAALTLGKVAMLSFDYEYINYNNANLEAAGNPFADENRAINNIYKSTSNIKIGGEVKLDGFYLRGGYALYGSPYSLGEANVDSNRSMVSGGIGLRNKFFFIDAGYSFYTEEMNYYMYVPQMLEGSMNTSSGNTAQLTLGFRF